MEEEIEDHPAQDVFDGFGCGLAQPHESAIYLVFSFVNWIPDDTNHVAWLLVR